MGGTGNCGGRIMRQPEKGREGEEKLLKKKIRTLLIQK